MDDGCSLAFASSSLDYAAWLESFFRLSRGSGSGYDAALLRAIRVRLHSGWESDSIVHLQCLAVSRLERLARDGDERAAQPSARVVRLRGSPD